MDLIFPILLFTAFLYLMMRYGCGAHMRGGGCGHSSHGHGNAQTNEDSGGLDVSKAKEMTRDPVCLMRIDNALASDSMRYGAETYYFCSKECHRQFQERPDYFREILRMEERYIA